MYASEVLATLTDAGLTVTVEGEALRVGPASRLTPRLRELIREHKPILLAILKPAPFTLVNDPADLTKVIAAVNGSELIGLDTETTGLDPRADRLRLLQLAPDLSRLVYVLDLFALD